MWLKKNWDLREVYIFWNSKEGLTSLHNYIFYSWVIQLCLLASDPCLIEYFVIDEMKDLICKESIMDLSHKEKNGFTEIFIKDCPNLLHIDSGYWNILQFKT